MSFLKIAILLIVLIFLSACGQKGPLFIPDSDEQKETYLMNIDNKNKVKLAAVSCRRVLLC